MLQSLKAGPAHIKKMTIVHACGPYGNDCSQSILANPPASRSVLLPPRCTFEQSRACLPPALLRFLRVDCMRQGRPRRDGYRPAVLCRARGAG